MKTRSIFARRAVWCAALCMVSSVFFTPLVARAQEVTLAWQATMPATEYYWYTGAKIVQDAAGNTYTAGHHLYGYISTAKFDPNGQFVWEQRYTPTIGIFKATWINLDPSGNLIVTGTQYGSGSGDDSSTSGWIVLKYNAQGTLIWNREYAFTRGKTVRTELDAAGNIYVVGRAWYGTDDIVVKKIAPDGTERWTQVMTLDYTSIESANSIAVTPAGDVAVVGSVIGWMLLGRFDTNGAVVWTKTFEHRSGNAVAFTPAGEVVVAGVDWTGASGVQMGITKYSATGNLLWANTYPGNVGDWMGIDSQGNILSTGYASPLPGKAYLDWMTNKISPSGTLLWSNRYDQHTFNDEYPRFLRIGSDDAVYVTGTGGPGPASGNVSYLKTVTLKYLLDGTQSWLHYTDVSVSGVGIHLGADNSVSVIGLSPLTVFHFTQSGGGTVNQPPTAVASGTPLSGTAPLAVTFSSAGSSDSDGTIASYSWAFGDGGTSTSANPSHTYATAGTYAATLTVTDDDGAQATASVSITVTSVTTSTRLHVAAQTVTRVLVKGSQYLGQDVVLVQDEGNKPIAGATVSANYSGPNSGSAKATTGTAGTATLKSKKFSNPGTQWCFTVTNMTKAGYTYNASANVVTTQCENGPASAAVEVAEALSIYPNPFNPETTIDIELTQSSEIDLRIYNVLGQEVAVLARQDVLQAGRYQYRWNGTDLSGQQLPTGVYYLRMLQDGEQSVFSLSLVK
ncbi:MAG: PKD domain-containing protein [Rhodothermales bacterium]|nr:PKD domain-containing protein [Rhodothermales bacterium]